MASNRSLGTLTLDLVLKMGGFTEGWSKAERETDKRTRAIQAKAQAFGKAMGAAIGVGFTAAAAGLAVYIRNTMEAEKVQAQLQARLKDTGGAAQRTLADLNRLADEFSQKTIFDDETIGEAQALLLTFTQIQGVNFDKTVDSALDLATVMGTDLTSATKLLGRALSDPEKGLAALTRAGIVFTEAERERIKVMADAGQVAEAQEAILAKLQGTMGTAAEAARNTLSGAIQGLKNDFDNLLEGDVAGGGMKGTIDAVNSLASTINDPSIKRGLDSMAEGLLTVANGAIQVVAKLGEAGSAVLEFFGDAERRSSTMLRNQRNELESQMFNLERRIKKMDPVNSVANPLGFLVAVDQEALAKTKRDIAEIDEILERRRRAGMFAGVQSRVLGPTPTLPDVDPSRTPAIGGGGGSRRQMPNFADEEQRRLEDMVRQAAEAMRAFDQLAATLSGPLAEAEYQHQQNLEEITRLGKEAGRASAEVDELKAKETQRYEEQTAAIRRQLDPGAELLGNLTEELRLIGMTNEERMFAIETRDLDAESLRKYGDDIRKTLGEIRKASEQTELMDGMRSSFQDFFSDVLQGTQSIGDAFKDMLSSISAMIAERIAQNWVDQLFGQMGSTNGGTAGGGQGGWFSTFASWFGSLYGGGRAAGGAFSAGSIYRVNESGLEMASVGGRDYLLTGGKGGYITPADRVGGGVTQNITFKVEGTIDLRSQAQIKSSMYAAGLYAARRNE